LTLFWSLTYAISTLFPLVLQLKLLLQVEKVWLTMCSDEIPAELIQAGEILLVIHKLINSIWKKEQLPDRCKESIIVPVHKKDDEN
jgi:hypothetical protein